MAQGNGLTAIAVANLLKSGTTGRHRASKNLYLQVRGKNTGSWLLRYMRDGKAHWMGLGRADVVTLQEARAKATDNGKLIVDGIDPLAAKRAETTAARIKNAKSITFGKCAKDYLTTHAPSWRNDKHTDQWYATFQGGKRTPAATAVINDLPVSEINTALAMKVLEPLWTKTPETATRVRQRCEQVIAFATAREYRAGPNPFLWRGHLDNLLPAPVKLKRLQGNHHHPAMAYADIPAFMPELRRSRFITARALEFCILTATRTAEVLGATWDEINFDTKTWTIPDSRMKAGKEHRVPLSNRVLEILTDLEREDDNPFVFIGGRAGRGLSPIAMLQFLKPLRPDVTVHGFRSTFRTWAAEQTAFPHHVCEQALAHTLPNAVERAYQRGDLFDKRRKLMAAWSDYCAAPVSKTTSNVTPLRRKAKAS
jgi:integrase